MTCVWGADRPGGMDGYTIRHVLVHHVQRMKRRAIREVGELPRCHHKILRCFNFSLAAYDIYVMVIEEKSDDVIQ